MRAGAILILLLALCSCEKVGWEHTDLYVLKGSLESRPTTFVKCATILGPYGDDGLYPAKTWDGETIGVAWPIHSEGTELKKGDRVVVSSPATNFSHSCQVLRLLR